MDAQLTGIKPRGVAGCQLISLPEFLVETGLVYQFLMGSLLHDLALSQHHNLIGQRGNAQVMGRHNNGAI